jgi:hypothetical protein
LFAKNKTLVIASVLMATALTGIFSTNPMAAYAGDDYDGNTSNYNGTARKVITEKATSNKQTNGYGTRDSSVSYPTGSKI